MSFFGWVVTSILVVDVALLAVSFGAAWWRERPARQLEAAYRLPAREPRMRA